MSFLCDSIYFITVFLFGTVASVCFTGVPFNRKNILTLSVFCALDGILQIISFAVFGQEISRGLYPVVVHLPLVLFLWLIYKCSWITSIVRWNLLWKSTGMCRILKDDRDYGERSSGRAFL